MKSILLLNEIIYRPIFNLLIVFLAIFGGNLGWAIICLTLLVRLIMIKSSIKGSNMQKDMGDLQPKLQEIQEKYKDNPEKLSQETMKVFKTSGKGPLKGCLMMLVQIPVFIGLFYVIRDFANGGIEINSIYSFLFGIGKDYVSVDNVNTNFFGMDLLGKNSVVLTVLAVIFTYTQMKLTGIVKPKTPTAGANGKNMPDMSKMTGFMTTFMTFLMGVFVYSMQSGIGLYIVTTSVFSTIQYSIQYRAILKVKTRELYYKLTKKQQIIKK